MQPNPSNLRQENIFLDNHTENNSEDVQNIDINEYKHARDKRRRCLRIKRPNNHGKYFSKNYLMIYFYAIIYLY